MFPHVRERVLLLLESIPVLTCALQERWVNESRAAAKLVIQCGEKVLTLFREMEQCGRISPSTFRCCETLQVPEDMMTLCQKMDAQYGKPTASKLREECGAKKSPHSPGCFT